MPRGGAPIAARLLRRLFPRLLACALPCLLPACEALDQGDLAARAEAPPAAPGCASCHDYPLRDINHAYHLFQADTVRLRKNVNGPVTCLDCHASSMASREHLLLDSICIDFLKPSGWSSFDEPEDFRRCLAANPLARVDTVRQRRPVPLPERPGEEPDLEEWMTAYAHLDGTVDVRFDPRASDTAENPAGAQWDPPTLTCSAVACHEHHGHYRWASPSRGLSGLSGHEGDHE